MTKQRWQAVAAIICIAATGCSRTDGEAAQNTRRPQQAGTTNPLVTAGHFAGVEAAGLTGDQRAVQGHVEAMHKDMMRSMHLADPSRRIDHEAARATVRRLQGVRSVVWIDNANLLVMVGGGLYRSMATIDNVCLALEPLGDTLSVVVNVQDVMATTSEGADTLSRNCQLGAGSGRCFSRSGKWVCWIRRLGECLGRSSRRVDDLGPLFLMGIRRSRRHVSSAGVATVLTVKPRLRG